MALEIQGRLIKVLEPVTGEGRNGAWTKQEFVIETSEQYPKKICCTAWGDKVEALRRFQLGEDMRVGINLESKEFKERWFTEIRAWKLDSASGASNQFAPPSQQYAQAPQYGAPAPQYSAPAQVPNFEPAQPKNDNFFKADDQDDLPF